MWVLLPVVFKEPSFLLAKLVSLVREKSLNVKSVHRSFEVCLIPTMLLWRQNNPSVLSEP